MMLCAKFGWNWPSGSGEEFGESGENFVLFHYYFPLVKGGLFIWRNVNSLHSRMLFAKFAWNLPDGSEEDQNVKSLQTDDRRTIGDYKSSTEVSLKLFQVRTRYLPSANLVYPLDNTWDTPSCLADPHWWPPRFPNSHVFSAHIRGGLSPNKYSIPSGWWSFLPDFLLTSPVHLYHRSYRLLHLVLQAAKKKNTLDCNMYFNILSILVK